MSFSFIAIIKTLILPPALNFILIAIGLCFKQKKILSRLFLYAGTLSLVLFCLPVFSSFLLKNLETYPALEPPVIIDKEQAIVILSGGTDSIRKEYGKETITETALPRMQYLVFLYKQVELPVLVTGGLFEPKLNSEAAVMADVLNNSFNIEVSWLEEQSRNTAENAKYSAAILKENNINSVYLVTHAWHMPRSVMMFEQQGIDVTPAPTIFTNDNEYFDLRDYIPSASALFQTRIALHEYVGILWYKLRYN